MPYNEKTTMKPDGSKTVRKEHIDATTGKCFKIEITEYPSSQPDFSVMSHINKKPKTTVIYPKDNSDQDTGFHDTLMPVLGKTTIGKTTIKTVETNSVPKPTTTPIKVDIPTVNKAAVAEQAVTKTPAAVDGLADGLPTANNSSAQQNEATPAPPLKTKGEGSCCVIS
jgi:hypothetical protein